MESEKALISVRSRGEVEKLVATVMATATASTVVDTLGRRVRAEWDPTASVTPMGQLVYFAQFLATAGLFSDWVKNCPLGVYSTAVTFILEIPEDEDRFNELPILL